MSDAKTLKSALDVKVKALNEAMAHVEETMTVEGDTVHIDEKAYNEITELKGDIRKITELARTDREIAEAKSLFELQEDQPATWGDSYVQESKSLADMVFESEEYKEMVEGRRTEMRNAAQFEVADIASYGQKDVYSAQGPYTSTIGIGTRRQQAPWVFPPERKPRVRDLFPVARTNANLIEYFKVLGFGAGSVNNAATVAERRAANGTDAPVGNQTTDVFGMKPKSTISFESAADPVRTIAHWTAVHRNTLADRPQLQSIINNMLLYGLALEEDDQLLNGDGTGENILGLLNRAGLQTYTPGVATELKSDSLRRAQTLAQLALYPANGYVLHPNDWQDIELQKGQAGTGGDGQYMLVTNVSVGAQERLWRLPVVATPVIAEGTFLTANFGVATQVYDRESASVRIAEQHADFFVRNANVILVEERIGLAVPVPGAVIKGTFGASSQ